MSIITTAQAVPSRLFTLYAALAPKSDGEERARLEGWATPPSLASRGGDEDGEPSTTLFVNALNEAKRLGLVEEDAGKLRLGPDARAQAGRTSDHERGFQAFMAECLFDTQRAEDAQQSGFLIALAWFLTVDPRKPLSFGDPPQTRLMSELGQGAKTTELTSLNRYQNFLYWARFMGFASIFGAREQDEKEARLALPDPYPAIARVLPALFASNDEQSGDTFIGKLSSIYPVLDGGAIRQQVEAMGAPLSYGTDRHVSLSLSFALKRLADRRLIHFKALADAPPILLDFGTRTQRVTHVAHGAAQ